MWIPTPGVYCFISFKNEAILQKTRPTVQLCGDEFAKTGRTSRGQYQRQIGIWVLQATAMPSVLVETGYITNREEEDYLNSKDGQHEIAKCITDAVRNYITCSSDSSNRSIATHKIISRCLQKRRRPFWK
jgi:N-acetylmuramoyl-L-alanine amidase